MQIFFPELADSKQIWAVLDKTPICFQNVQKNHQMHWYKLHIPTYGVFKLWRCEHASKSEPAEIGQHLHRAVVAS
jgi:hypothetical protein